MDWNSPAIHKLIGVALQEDRSRSDITTRILIDPAWRIEATIVAKQKGVVAGLPLAKKLFQSLDSTIQFKPTVSDGAFVRLGQRLAVIKGRARSILSAERPALNALQHLSGIATFTRAMVTKIDGTRPRLYDTRKTLPGWRDLQKYAVKCGGGANHRFSLADAILIKDNHLQINRLAGRDWIPKAARVLHEKPALSLQVEIQNDQDLRDVLRLKPELILLDNLSFPKLRKMVKTVRKKLPGTQIEVSGGVRPEDLRRLSRLGVDRISMGRLTHSVAAFDCSLDIVNVYPH